MTKKTLKEILMLECFTNIKVIAGDKGLENVVSGATVMEVPDIFPYLENNTLLITTLYPISDSKIHIDEFIPRLKESNISGICIKPMRYINSIPDIMIQQGNALNFPIIELPSNANLSVIVNKILEISLEDYINQLKFRDNVHNTLMNMLLNGAGIVELVENLSLLLQKEIILLNRRLSPICAVTFNEAGQIASITDIEVVNTMISNYTFIEGTYIKYPIKAGRSSFGYIYLPNVNDENEYIKLAVEQSAMLLATVFFKNQAVMQNQQNFKDVFIRDLLQKKITSSIELEKKLLAFNLTISFPQTVAVMRLFTDDEEVKNYHYDKIINMEIISEFYYVFFGKKPTELNVVYFNDALVILHSEVKNNEFYNFLLSKITLKYKIKCKLGVGLSNLATGFESLDVAYKQAVSAVNIGGIINEKSFVSTYDSCKMFQLIEKVKDHELLRAILNEKLGKIIEYDKKNDSDLMRTLHFLIQENFNYKRTAQIMYVHYNTIRYRVKKLEELGLSFEAGYNLGELIVAYNIFVWIKSVSKI